jgi:hypothetical protein
VSIAIERPDAAAVLAPWVTRVVSRDLWATDTSNVSIARCATTLVNARTREQTASRCDG